MSHKLFRSFYVLILIIGLMTIQAPQPARAAGPWYVATTGDDNNDCLSSSTPCATIQGAIGKATAGDIVNVAVGTYTASGVEVVLIDKDITISGGWNTTFTAQGEKSIIDGEGTRRGVLISGPSISVEIENFDIQNCYTENWQQNGAIYLYGSLTLNNSVIQNNQTTGIYYETPGTTSLAINNSTIANNVSPDPLDITGGIQILGSGTVTINNSSVSGNTGSGISNGEIGNEDGVVSINGSTISNNHGAAWGAGINNYGDLTIVSSTIDQNVTASGYNIFGGGIYNQGNLTISNSIIRNNMSHGMGGGLYNIGIAHINTSELSENIATVGGGGIYVVGNWVTSIMLNVINSTVSNNEGGIGGGLYLGDSWNGSGSSASLHNVTITQNVATNTDGTGLGGGIYVQSSSSANVKNSLLVQNTAMDGPDCSGHISSSGYNLIANTSDCTFSSTTGDLLNVDPLLGPLQDNGGPTLTHALLPGSPAIDAGNPAGCTDQDGIPLNTDQRGITRPQGAACDIGAFELEIASPVKEVTIDIKPGSQLNPINRKSLGKIPVAILSTPDFDAPSEIDKASLTFGRTGDEASLAFCNKGAEDVNSDGLLDQVCHFYTEKTGFQKGDTKGILKGLTVDGTSIEGNDLVRIVR